MRFLLKRKERFVKSVTILSNNIISFKFLSLWFILHLIERLHICLSFNFKYFLFHPPGLSDSIKETVRFIGETNFM